MKNSSKTSRKKHENLPNDTLNENMSARPTNTAPFTSDETDPDVVTRGMDYGEMNLQDAKESGYTDKNGHAVSKAKKDVTGSPTGAYTDVGAGRSSVVHHHSPEDKKTHH